jgi:branched-chain amino acid transport system ATP-binding protein
MRNSATPLLSLLDLHVAYGGIQAVRGINLHINEGETVALIGANGAGKTTTLKAIARLINSQGEIRFAGKSLQNQPSHELLAKGISLVPEGRGIFPRLTVAENLAMGAFLRNDKTAVSSDLEQAYQRFPRLAERSNQLAGTLSGGEQQMLAIERALMGRPRLLLLDEPSMGLAPLMVAKIFEVVQAVAKAGMTVLLVEQNAKLALKVSQRAYVLESGEVTLNGSSSDLLNDARVKAAYLGD